MMDYTIFYKKTLSVKEEGEDWEGWEESWDLFLSAYNLSERVKGVYEHVNAAEKLWLIQPDYNFSEKDYPSEEKFISTIMEERGYIKDLLSKLDGKLIGKKVCIDITGFIKPFMMALFYELYALKVKSVDVIYSEPGKYEKKEETKFSSEFVREVAQVDGFMGNHEIDMSNDLLIIGAGYDDQLISQVAKDRAHCRKVLVYGLPSLRPDMYQENLLNVSQASEAVDVEEVGVRKFAPANDPFVTAQSLQEICAEENEVKKVTNIYLSPLATKPQALGFTLFYLFECQGKGVSMIYPYCDLHSKKTSEGISRIWKYVIEFP